MADALNEIIKKLEQQKSAIDKALSALKEVDGTPGSAERSAEPAARKEPAAKKARRKGGITSEGRRRLSESLKARWAAKRADDPEPATATRKSPGRKRGRKPQPK